MLHVMRLTYALSLLLLISTTALSTTHTVYTTQFAGTGSISAAIAAAGSGDTVLFSTNLSGSSILFTSQFTISTNLTIIGPGADLLTFDANPLGPLANLPAPTSWRRHFEVTTNGNLTLIGLSLIHGGGHPNNWPEWGGGSVITAGTFNAIECEFANNVAQYGAAIRGNGTININRCSFIDNQGVGGSNNIGAIHSYNNNLTITNSTFYGNSSYGQSVYSSGAIVVSNCNLSMTHVTMAANSGGTASAIYSKGNSNVSLNDCLIGDQWGGFADIYLDNTYPGNFYATNCILDNNCFLPGGNNTNVIWVNSVSVGAPAYNGGHTRTMALQSTSIAVDAGAYVNPVFDQRGYIRTSAPDIGAFELNAMEPAAYACSTLGSASGTNELNVQPTSVTLHWTTTPNATSYKIRYKVAGTNNWTTAWKNTNQGRKTITGLTPGTTYKWTVQARCGTNATPPTPQNGFTTLTSACAIPTGLSVSNVGITQTKIQWAAVSGAVKYQLRWRAVGVSTWNVLYKTAPSTHHWATGLWPGVLYEWKIKAHCQYGATTGTFWSPVQTFTTQFKAGSVPLDVAPEQQELRLSPNPASSHVSVSLPDGAVNEQLLIFDAVGRIVEQQRPIGSMIQIDVSKYPAGSYMVRYGGSVVPLMVR